MDKPGIKRIVAGAIVIMLAIVFAEFFRQSGSNLIQYALLAVGAALAGLGAIAALQSKKEAAPDSGTAPENLVHDTLFRTLARMSNADTNIKNVEVETIAALYEELTGNPVSTADIRVAARADLYEDGSFMKYLSSIEGKIERDGKRLVMDAMCTVVRADDSVSPMEVEFFNDVAKALCVDAADLKDLTAACEARTQSEGKNVGEVGEDNA